MGGGEGLACKTLSQNLDPASPTQLPPCTMRLIENDKKLNRKSEDPYSKGNGKMLVRKRVLRRNRSWRSNFASEAFSACGV